MARSRVKIAKTKTKTKAKPAERATPTSKVVYTTDAEKVTCADGHISSMKASPSWATATDVQASATAWATVTASLTANDVVITGLREQLTDAVGVQVTLRGKWLAARKHVLSTVGVFCAGSVELIEGLGFEVLTHAVQEITALTSIVTTPGSSAGEVDASWDETVNRHGFMLQHASDPANAATYSPFIPCTVGSFTLGGQVSAATVYFRVAAIDPSQPTHLTAWSPWVAGTAH